MAPSSTATSTPVDSAQRGRDPLSLERRWFHRPVLSPIGSSITRAARDASRAVLLAAVAPDAMTPESTTLDRALSHGGNRIDWGWILDRARAHKVASLLLSTLEQRELAHLVPPVHAEIVAEIHELAAHRTALAGETLDEVLSLLEDRGIPCLVVKGAMLAERIYGDPMRRPHSDIDLVVRPEDLERAAKALEGAGYSPSFHESARLGLPVDRQRRHALRTSNAFGFRRPDRMQVELHWRLFAPGTPRVRPEQAWSETTSAVVRSRSVRTLDAPAELVYLAAHAVNLGPLWNLRLLHLCDFAWALERFGADAPWAHVERIASEWNCARHFTLALSVCARLFPHCTRLASLAERRSRRRGARPIDLVAMPARVVDQIRTPIPVVRSLERIAVGTIWECAIGRSPLASDGIARRGLRRFIPALERRRARAPTPP